MHTKYNIHSERLYHSNWVHTRCFLRSLSSACDSHLESLFSYQYLKHDTIDIFIYRSLVLPWKKHIKEAKRTIGLNSYQFIVEYLHIQKLHFIFYRIEVFHLLQKTKGNSRLFFTWTCQFVCLVLFGEIKIYFILLWGIYYLMACMRMKENNIQHKAKVK